MEGTSEALLDVRGLRTYFSTGDGDAKAVDGISFRLERGKTLGLVGESGCGKSVTALSIMRLLESPPARIVAGEVWFQGRDLVSLSEKELRSIRGDRVSMIFQEPMTSLNPVFTIGEQIAEVFRTHRGMGRKEAFAEAVRMLETVRIPAPAQRAREYPHQMSGGMRQRVMIAMALACSPALLIADEPTTALDVTVQGQILKLMEELQEELDTSLIMITHDLGVVAETADDVAVMYAGQIVENAPVNDIFESPRHPYTRGLLRSIPRLDAIQDGARLEAIPGTVPDASAFPSGCRFHPRCAFATDLCRRIEPELENAGGNHYVRCHYHETIA